MLYYKKRIVLHVIFDMYNDKGATMSHLERFQKLLVEKGFDAAIVSDKMNQRYLSGFDFDDGLVFVTQKEAYLLTDFRYAEAAQEKTTKEMKVLLPKEGHLACIASLLSSHGCKNACIEELHLSYGDFQRYEKLLSPVALSGGASEMLSFLRLHKDDEEIETVTRAQKITDAAFSHILNFIKPDMTEVEVALELEYFMKKNGAEALAFDTIAVSGTNSSRPHGVPRHCKLEKGFLTMDFGARVDGYCSDMTRTVVLGRADEEIKRVYNTVLRAQTAALEAAHEGIGCRELDGVARDIIHSAGFEGCFGHSLGHGLGMLVHENPRVAPGAAVDSVLERGHIVSVEPGIYIAGKYGCRIEDLICIRNDGSVYNFTHSPKELIELF